MNTRHTENMSLDLNIKGAVERWRLDPGQVTLFDYLLTLFPACMGEVEQLLFDQFGIRLLHKEDLTSGEFQVTGLSGDGLRIERRGESLLLFDNPWHPEARKAMRRFAGKNPCLAVADSAVRRLVVESVGQTSASSPKGAQLEVHSASSATAGAGLIVSTQGDVVQFVDDVIRRAYMEGASDIHFETGRAELRVRYRLDGVMVVGEVFSQASRLEEVISRIKVMSHLDITERRRPQDGRIHWADPARDMHIDLRVSVMPSIFGEDAVLRLLDKAQLRDETSQITLDSLGFSDELCESVRGLVHKPFGMILVTGPTGSGKTTTVYAALSEVNNGLEKIITIEDPVEYELPGVLQIPVNEQKGLTFATGLRSILRHDPDKILVGEIRDSETAQIAIQSALTGHLVFTTVHANNLFDVLGRFQHFGIDGFAMGSAINGILVQRLLRRVCGSCLSWREPGSDQEQVISDVLGRKPSRMPVSVGCEACRHTGYKGRLVVAEVHAISETVKDLIAGNASLGELRRELYADRKDSLIYQALHAVELGETTLEEVRRVVGLA
ncbi:GspE/PulE family protein [Hydrogenophaga sp. 5NK40-0174]|uniref:GspE/PulE family protein n=1 Tax=Hydrogenophaga sp. 5NK40-0174 TaxID=3127649 RepID=UPI003103D020